MKKKHYLFIFTSIIGISGYIITVNNSNAQTNPNTRELTNNILIPTTAATNEFVIGIEGVESRHTRDANYNIQTSVLNSTGFPSSAMNVVAQDGFNTIRSFFPDLYISFTQMIQLTQLVSNNNLKIIYDDEKYYSPYFDVNFDPATNPTGQNFYEYDTQNPNLAYMNLNSLYSQVYSNPSCSTAIWGHMVTGESCFYHHFYDHTNTYRPPALPCNPFSTTLTQCLADYLTNHNHAQSDDWLYTEAPPQNVSDAFNHFEQQKQQYNIPNQKLMQVQAHHGWTLNSNLPYDYDGIYAAADYLTMNNVTNPNNGDVFLEGSYFTNQFASYLSSDNYLGKFESVLYAKQFYDQVLVEIDLEHGNDLNSPYMFHSNPLCPNANQQWHQAYGSIIHGASGVLFYGLIPSYNENNATEVINKSIFLGNAQNDRYTLNYFPNMYKNYTRNLGRELRYLVNNNFLSTDAKTVVGSRTDQLDPFCILPISSSYIPATLTSTNAKDLIDAQPSVYNSITPPISNPKTGEKYGIRYTIRQNSNGEAIIILANMTPFHLGGVPLNFNNVANQAINGSVGVDVLFEVIAQNIYINTYKTNRASNIDLINNTVGQSYYIPYPTGNKTVTLAFAPFDVHVLKFRPKPNFPAAGYDNGWQQIWSNNGDGNIGDWGPLLTTDKVIKGNFDGGGSEEILFIQGTSVNPWATIEKYDQTTNQWSKLVGNSGNSQIGSWAIQAGDKFVAGNFTGDIKDELLCIRSGSSGVLATMLSLVGNTWQSLWTNNSSNTIGSWVFNNSDRFVVGDFNSDGQKDILAFQELSASSGKVHLLRFKSGNFNSYWNNASNDYIGSWNLQSGDNIVAGDFDGNGFANQIACFQTNGSSSSILTFNSASWTQNWLNTTGSFGGWGVPGGSTNDKLVVGNIDGDAKDEFLFIQRCNPCGWATSIDLNSSFAPQWNWSNHSYPLVQQNYIDTWDVNTPSGSTTDYLLVKAKTNNLNQLLAWRRTSCGSNNVLISLYETIGTFNYRESDQKTTELINIFPNPANENIKIDFSNTFANQHQIIVYDLLGKVYYQEKLALSDNGRIHTIDLSQFASGIYLIAITDENNTVNIKKIVVSH
jgi:Secretion system C-terminal sorting domain